MKGMKELFELAKSGKLMFGTYISRERMLELNQAFLANPKLNEIFIETEIRIKQENKDEKV